VAAINKVAMISGDSMKSIFILSMGKTTRPQKAALS